MAITHKILFNPTTVSFDLNKGDDYAVTCLLMGADTKLTVNLNEEGTNCNITLIYLSDNKNNNKVKCIVNHNAPHTTSDQHIKGIADETGKGVFEGLIYMAPNAVKCTGNQHHQALLLSDDAEVKCIPELSILVDDVSCAHGSAIGPLDEEQLFYLNSRGIGMSAAKKILVKGFLFDNLPDELNEKIMKWINDHV